MNRHLRSIIIAAVTCTFVIMTMCNNAYDENKTGKLDALLSMYAEYGKFNGTVLIVDHGEVIYKKGFGFADMESKTLNRPDTKFRLASVTKQFTAMLVVQLAAENRLELNTPISAYLPDYPEENGNRITIHHLLTHTSGIPEFTSFPGYWELQRTYHSPQDLVNLFADSTLDFTPGERFQYSNSGYVLLGYIIEKVTGKTYEEVLQENIFTPLQMHNTGYDHNDKTENKALGYIQNLDNYQSAAYIDMSVPYAAGGIYSTVEDLYLWDNALYGDQLLPKEELGLLFKQYVSTGQQQSYGYGWFIENLSVGNSTEQVQTISHGGMINGFNTLITRIPSEQSLIILLNNTGSVPLQEMAIAINGILHNRSYDLPRQSIARSLLEMAEKNDINTTITHYQKIRYSKDYYLNEYEMNQAGYILLQSGKPAEAAVIFRLNVESYPNSFNAYDSYAESLLALGDSAGAVENYTKSVTLNIGNVNGLKKLKELGVNTDAYIVTLPIEDLQLLEGVYQIVDPSAGLDKNWKIEIKMINRELTANDRGYRYSLVAIKKNEFVNPDDGASVVFDTKDMGNITLTLGSWYKFRKIIQ